MKGYKYLCSLMFAALILSTIPHVHAYLTDGKTKNNAFTVNTNDIEIIETYNPPASILAGGSFVKKVQVKNTSKVDCYVRVFAEMETPEMANALTPDWNTSKWTKSGSYYYYNDVLKAGATTEALFTKITAKANLDDFAMIIYAESMQSQGFQNWGDAFHEN